MHWVRAAAGVALSCALIGACVVGERPSAEHLSCAEGECICTAGFGNCDADANNGCEAVLDVDPKNCGACGTICVNGLCEAGLCACNSGFFDCNGEPEDGCEALVRADPDNCGECGHSCLGGDCTASSCAPFLLAELGTYIYALAANATDVFYCDGESGVLYRVGKGSGEVEQLVADQNCYSMAASDSHLFWSVIENGEELVRIVPATGGASKTIAVTDRIDGFAASGQTVLWSEYDDVGMTYDIFTAEALGTRTSIAQSTESIRDIIAVENRVYWIEGSTAATTNLIRTAPITGGGAATLVSRDEIIVRDIVVVADMLYWFQTDSEGDDPKILRVRSSGGAEEELYLRNREINHLLGDATGLYWTEDQGDRWLRGSLEGGDVEVIAEFQDITLPVLGSDSLLWIDFPSHLFALAK